MDNAGPSPRGSPQYLNGSAAGGDEGLHCCCVISSCKFLLLRFPSFHHGYRHQFFVHPGVKIQDLQHLQKAHSGSTLNNECSAKILHVLYYNNLVVAGQVEFKSALESVTSSAASSLVANAVCPSCHRNSLVLKKGCGCLNSHL